VQRQRVVSPLDVLPLAEVAQQLRCARLPHQGEIIEPEFLEVAVKPTVVFHLSYREQAPRPRCEPGKLDVAFLGIVRSG
jgi:hypothetical protein